MKVVEPRACVLVVPGGKVHSDQASRWWQLANIRMMFVAGPLRRRLGPDVDVRRVQYRRRGWNSPRFDAVRDAKEVLDVIHSGLKRKTLCWWAIQRAARSPRSCLPAL